MHELPDRFGPAWGLVMLTAAIAAVILLGRVLGRRGGASKAPPVALPEGGEEGEPEPVCRARGCLAPATRGIPEARPWRPVSWLLPRWEVVTDPEAEPALCAAHHGPLASALTARAAQERAALEEHLAARHRELVAWAQTQVQRDHGIAPAPPRPAPSPLRAPTVPPLGAPAVEPVPAETPDGPPS